MMLVSCKFELVTLTARGVLITTDALDTPEKIWDLTHNINVKGVWYGCKHGVIAMRKVSYK